MTTLAIDIGGTKIAAAVCDENDSIIQRWRVPRIPRISRRPSLKRRSSA